MVRVLFKFMFGCRPVRFAELLARVSIEFCYLVKDSAPNCMKGRSTTNNGSLGERVLSGGETPNFGEIGRGSGAPQKFWLHLFYSLHFRSLLGDSPRTAMKSNGPQFAKKGIEKSSQIRRLNGPSFLIEGTDAAR